MTFEEALSTSSVNGGDRTVREALEVLQDWIEKTLQQENSDD